MADFCQQCSIHLFGKDFRDLAGIVTTEDLANGGCWVICEGCGQTTVDTEGRCLNEDCLEKGHKVAKYQERVMRWMYACFGGGITEDPVERNHRFLEESLELVQALGYSQDQALKMVEYVYSRPAGNPHQEIGGTLVCLAALASVNGLDMQEAGEAELMRCFDKTEVIRGKRANKPAEVKG